MERGRGGLEGERRGRRQGGRAKWRGGREGEKEGWSGGRGPREVRQPAIIIIITHTWPNVNLN